MQKCYDVGLSVDIIYPNIGRSNHPSYITHRKRVESSYSNKLKATNKTLLFDETASPDLIIRFHNKFGKSFKSKCAQSL